MTSRVFTALSFSVSLFLSLPLAAQNIPLTNWPVSTRHFTPRAAADLGNAAVFTAITPCRVLDTRNPAGPYGGPAFASSQTRSFSIPGSPCTGIPAAAAYSFNFVIVSYQANLYVTAFPTGTTRPNVATVNAGSGPPIGNAAIVPASATGSIDVFAAGTTDLIIDINGYFSDSRASLNSNEQLALFGTVAG